MLLKISLVEARFLVVALLLYNKLGIWYISTGGNSCGESIAVHMDEGLCILQQHLILLMHLSCYMTFLNFLWSWPDLYGYLFWLHNQSFGWSLFEPSNYHASFKLSTPSRFTVQFVRTLVSSTGRDFFLYDLINMPFEGKSNFEPSNY